MDDVSALRLDIVRLKISEGGDIRVSCLAVIALVVVVGQDLPVVGALHLPAVVEYIVVEVKLVVLLLLIGSQEVLLPRDLGHGLGVKVDPDEAVAVDVHVDGEQAVLGLVEARELLISRCLGQVATETI